MDQQISSLYCLYEKHLSSKNKYPFIGKRIWFQSSGTRNQEAITILIIEKVDFKLKLIRIYKESHVILTKKTPNEGDITFPNIYAPVL